MPPTRMAVPAAQSLSNKTAEVGKTAKRESDRLGCGEPSLAGFAIFGAVQSSESLEGNVANREASW